MSIAISSGVVLVMAVFLASVSAAIAAVGRVPAAARVPVKKRVR